MKRLRHIVWNGLVGVSALVCVAACVFWVRGYFISDSFFREKYQDVGDRSYWIQDMVRSGRGGIGMNEISQGFKRGWRYGRKAPFHRTLPAEYPNFKVGVGDQSVWGGFKHGAFSHPEPMHVRPRAYGWQIVVPFWSIVPPTAIAPLIAIWRRSRRRITFGNCASCGYDMRATPMRCPECGREVVNQA